MEHFLEFARSNPFTFFIMVCATYYLLKYVFYHLPVQILRSINIHKNGWPPEHCDADGNSVAAYEEDDEDDEDEDEVAKR